MATKWAFVAARISRRALAGTAVSAALWALACQSNPHPASPQPSANPARSVRELCEAMPERVGNLDGRGDVARFADEAARVPGVARVERSGATSLRLVLGPPLPARRVAHWLGLGHAFVVSDGHAWRVVGNPKRGPGGRGYHHVQATVPVFGDFRVDLRVDGRPEGPLPNALANGEPAYSLREYDAKVTTINLDSLR